VSRPEQLGPALLEAMRVLTDQAATGAVTICLPQDVQAEAAEFPDDLLDRRVWRVPRPAPDAEGLARAAALVRGARRPLVVAGGGVLYSDASGALVALAQGTGLPVAETQAGKGSVPFDHPCSLGAIGVTGTQGANVVARDADVVIGVGTRWSDFTTASRTAFQAPGVRFVNLNVAPPDAAKHAALGLVADARAGLEALAGALNGWQVDRGYADEIARHRREWEAEVDRIVHLGHAPLPSQGEVIGAVNEAARPHDVVVCAAGSLPGDLHKLWRTRDPGGYHLEYGYSTMGYEVAGGLGVKLADPSREVFVMVGDGSWLMLSSELVTARQEGMKLIVVLVDNHGFASIGSLSRSLGSGGFGTVYRARGEDGQLSGETLEVDFAANARSLGVEAVRVHTVADLRAALSDARAARDTRVVVVETDPSVGVPGYESWWDVPVAETSGMPAVRQAREGYARARERERSLTTPGD
jgi:3D-(3,5/4)-trihydroxycyclohexane-1,2-dione acylhydrolase (decyclizing)